VERFLDEFVHDKFLLVEIVAGGAGGDMVVPGLEFSLGEGAGRGGSGVEFGFAVDVGLHQLTPVMSGRREVPILLRKVFIARAKMPRRAPLLRPIVSSISRYGMPFMKNKVTAMR
jgi:hypothetical protein